MSASNLVKTESQRTAASLGLARTELNDAVNTGIVTSSDHGASLVLDHGARDVARVSSPRHSGGVLSGPSGEGVAPTAIRIGATAVPDAPPFSDGLSSLDQRGAVNATVSPKSGPRATGAAAMARRAVSSTLAGSEIEGLDTIAYVGYYGAKAARGAAQRHADKVAGGSAARAAGGAQRGLREPGADALMRATGSMLRGSEIEGVDDVYFGSRAGYRAMRSVERRLSRKPGSPRSASKSAARTQTRMQAKRHQMRAISEQQAARSAASSSAAKAAGAKASASAIGSAAASSSAAGGAGGAAAAAGGVGCLPIIAVLALVIFIPILVSSIFTTKEPESSALEGNERVVAEYLLDKGLDEVQVAAIIGNMYQESRVDPAAVNGDSGAFGICQWLDDRLDDLRAFCDARGAPYTDISAQLDFFWDEFTMARGGGWSFRSNYDDFMACINDDQLETAVEIFARHFERCDLGEMNLPNRNEHARRVLDALRTGGGAIAGVGDLQWPSDSPQWGTYPDHWGLDIQAGMGTPVFASADGVVVNAKYVGTWGNYVRINHGSLGVQTGYAHLSRFAVSEGDHVRKGQVIGYVGSTGNSTGPHLHYEIYERNSDRPGDTGGTPIYDDMDKWGKYFDRKALEANRVW